MGTESAQRMYRSVNDDSVAKDRYILFAIDESPAKRSRRLVADDQDGCFRLVQVASQMVHDSPGVAHSCPRHDQAGPIYIVERLGIGGGWAGFHHIEIAAQVARL